MIRGIGAAVAILLSLYILYLGARVMSERRTVSDRVDAIIASAEPADVTLTPRRTAMLVRVEDPTSGPTRASILHRPGRG